MHVWFLKSPLNERLWELTSIAGTASKEVVNEATDL